MSDQANNSIKKIISELLFIATIGVAFVFVASTILKFVNTPDKSKIEPIVKEIIKERETVIQKPTCEHTMESFNALKDKGQYIVLASDASSFGKDGKFVGVLEPTVLIDGEDEVACGFRLNGHFGRLILS